MTTAFDSLDALAAEAAVSTFGEVAVLQPRRPSQYVEAATDVDRLSVSVRGIFSAAAATHNGRNIGSSHIHGGVVSGGDLTDVPAN